MTDRLSNPWKFMIWHLVNLNILTCINYPPDFKASELEGRVKITEKVKMRKAKKYDWTDSNLALFGSDTEKNVSKKPWKEQWTKKSCRGLLQLFSYLVGKIGLRQIPGVLNSWLFFLVHDPTGRAINQSITPLMLTVTPTLIFYTRMSCSPVHHWLALSSVCTEVDCPKF